MTALIVVIALGCLALITMAALVGANALRQMAEDRAREAKYADEWVRRRKESGARLNWRDRP